MNKKVIFSAIGLLSAAIILLIIVLTSYKSGNALTTPTPTETEGTQQVINIDDPQDTAEVPAITPPADEEDPASGSDIVLTPTQGPATDTDLPDDTTPAPETELD